MLYDKLESLNTYNLGKHSKEIITFLEGLSQDSKEGRYPLSNGIFAIVMSYPTRLQQDAVLETHRKHIDFQMSITGAEGIEYFHRDDLTIKEEYSEKNDVAFYEYPGNPLAFIKNLEGYVTILWPQDAHMPQLKFDNNEFVKKVVVKVPIELI